MGMETPVGAPGLGFITASPVFIAQGSSAQISFPSRPSWGWGAVSLVCCMGETLQVPDLG